MLKKSLAAMLKIGFTWAVGVVQRALKGALLLPAASESGLGVVC